MKKTTLLLILMAVCLAAQTEQKQLYAGLRFGGSVGMVFPVGGNYRWYYDDVENEAQWWDGGSFDAAPFASWQFTPAFALHTEVMATRFGYRGEKYQYDDITEKFLISRRALLVPVLVKYTRRQFNQSFQFFIGPHFTYNFGRWRWHYYFRENGSILNNSKYHPQHNIYGEKQEIIGEYVKYPPIGITLGANFGFITTKAGTIFADVRFWQDLGMVKYYNEELMVWEPILLRGKLSFSLGYEFGFINR